jgi:molybdopterin converting factor small subunit
MATIRIPPVLRASVGGEKEVAGNGANVGEVLRDLAANHPATESQLFSAEGELNRYVNVYLNDEDVRVLDERSRRARDPAGHGRRLTPRGAIAPTRTRCGSHG